MTNIVAGLAKYFAGVDHVLARHFEKHGPSPIRAKLALEFFEARIILGLPGDATYVTQEEAREIISKAVARHFNKIGATKGGKAVAAKRTAEDRSAFASKGGKAARGKPRTKKRK